MQPGPSWKGLLKTQPGNKAILKLMDRILTANELRKSFGPSEVVRGVNLNFNSDETALLLGANGAGKSTLLRICSGLTSPDSGKVIWTKEVRKSFSGHHSFLYHRLSIKENLQLFRGLLGEAASLSELLERWGLSAHANKRIDDLSKGLQARASLCRAFLSEPDVLMLDEPTSALDTSGVDILTTELNNLRARKSGNLLVLLATHDLHRILKIASRIIVMADGKVIRDTAQEDGEVGRAVENYLESNR